MTRACLHLPAVLTLAAVLSGCAGLNADGAIDRSNTELVGFTQGQLALARSSGDVARRSRLAAELLAQPLGQADAVRLALMNSPALQALLASHAAEAAAAAQAGRLPNPVLQLERLRTGEELEIGRSLSFGLLELLTLPQRQRVAQARLDEQALRLSADVVERVTQVRQAWVRAVAARQLSLYAQQVMDSAATSAELARRMQATGNFNRLAHAREQAFYAESAARAASASHQALASREALVRLLGLDAAQAQTLRLPDRLPELPRQALDPEQASRQASEQRLDVRLAQARLNAAARAQGLGDLTSRIDIELGVIRNTTFGDSGRSTGRGAEIGLRLPLFDGGGLERQGLNARSLASARQLEATVRAAGSHLRESYSAYRTAHDIARHYRDEVVPLRKTISDENLLRYNGMLIGVFELLADAREQVATVMAAIEAEQQFWLAEAALQAGLVGQPLETALVAPSTAAPAAAGGH